ncbi:MAG: Asp23/Gls24 family envelope stress response protein [Collinsella sp.]
MNARDRLAWRCARKENLATEPIAGPCSVSNDVIADIAGYAAMSCYGVVGMAEQHAGRRERPPASRSAAAQGVLATAAEYRPHRRPACRCIEAGVNMRSVTDNLASSVALHAVRDRPDRSRRSLKIAIHIDGMKSASRSAAVRTAPAFTRRKCQYR